MKILMLWVSTSVFLFLSCGPECHGEGTGCEDNDQCCDQFLCNSYYDQCMPAGTEGVKCSSSTDCSKDEGYYCNSNRCHKNVGCSSLAVELNVFELNDMASCVYLKNGSNVGMLWENAKSFCKDGWHICKVSEYKNRLFADSPPESFWLDGVCHIYWGFNKSDWFNYDDECKDEADEGNKLNICYHWPWYIDYSRCMDFDDDKFDVLFEDYYLENNGCYNTNQQCNNSNSSSATINAQATTDSNSYLFAWPIAYCDFCSKYSEESDKYLWSGDANGDNCNWSSYKRSCKITKANGVMCCK